MSTLPKIGGLTYGSNSFANYFAHFVIGLIGCIPIAFFIGWIYGKIKLSRIDTRDKQSKSFNESKEVSSIKIPIQQQNIDLENTDEKYFELALKEIETNNLSKGIWAKALACENGNKDKVEATYLKQRAHQLEGMYEGKLEQERLEKERLEHAQSQKERVIDEEKENYVASVIVGLIILSVVSLFIVYKTVSENKKNSPTPPTIQKFVDKTPSQSSIKKAHVNGVKSYLKGNYYDAFRHFHYAAKHGDAISKNLLGSMYLEGLGIAKDYKKAVYWYRQSAEQGHAIGQFRLGLMYLEGLGGAADYNQTVYWFRKAAEQGDADAQYGLGTLYNEGIGVFKDYNQAVYWYRKAANQGHAKAQKWLNTIK